MSNSYTTGPEIYGRPQHDEDDPVRPSEFYGDAQHERGASPFGPVGAGDRTR